MDPRLITGPLLDPEAAARWCNTLYYRGKKAYWCRLDKGHPAEEAHTCPGEARETTPGWANNPY